jgi:hypothetical protein
MFWQRAKHITSVIHLPVVYVVAGIRTKSQPFIEVESGSRQEEFA